MTVQNSDDEKIRAATKILNELAFNFCKQVHEKKPELKKYIGAGMAYGYLSKYLFEVAIKVQIMGCEENNLNKEDTLRIINDLRDFVMPRKIDEEYLKRVSHITD